MAFIGTISRNNEELGCVREVFFLLNLPIPPTRLTILTYPTNLPDLPFTYPTFLPQTCHIDLPNPTSLALTFSTLLPDLPNIRVHDYSKFKAD